MAFGRDDEYTWLIPFQQLLSNSLLSPQVGNISPKVNLFYYLFF